MSLLQANPKVKKQKPQAAYNSKNPEVDARSAYRGFSTSFSHSFVDPREEQGDMCSLACCGALQMERNAHLLGAATPINFTVRFIIYVAVPLAVLTFAYYAKKHMADGEVFGFLLVLTYVLIMSAVFIRALRQRVHVRREILMRQHDKSNFRPDEEQDDEREDPRLMGQTTEDIYCAHLPCGCYRGDVYYEELEAPLPVDLCDIMWQASLAMCCEYFHNTFVQCCGACGIAQESRELNKMVAPHRRAIDYVTLQPILEFYIPLLHLRRTPSYGFRPQLKALSQLSCHLILTYIIALACNVAVCSVVNDRALRYNGITSTIFTVFMTIGLLFLYFSKAKADLTLDAVIKSFSGGLYIAPSLTVPFLAVLYIISQGSMATVLSFTYNVSYYNHGNGGFTFYDTIFFTPWKSKTGATFGNIQPILYLIWLFCQCIVFAFIEEVAKYMVYRMMSYHPEFWTKSDLDHLVHETKKDPKSEVDLDKLLEVDLKAHVRPISIRCKAVMVSCISISVGYAVMENLVYSYMHSGVRQTWVHLLVRAFIFLIHPACAMWQAIGICKSDLGLDTSYRMGKIVAGSVVLHFLADYLIIAGDLVAIGFAIDNPYLMWLCRFGVPALILLLSTLIGACVFASLQATLTDKEDPEGEVDNQNTWDWEVIQDDDDTMDRSAHSSHSGGTTSSKGSFVGSKSLNRILMEARSKKYKRVYQPGEWSELSGDPVTSYKDISAVASDVSGRSGIHVGLEAQRLKMRQHLDGIKTCPSMKSTASNGGSSVAPSTSVKRSEWQQTSPCPSVAPSTVERQQELRQTTSGCSSAAPSKSERQQELRQTTSGSSSAAPSTSERLQELRVTTSGSSSAAPSTSERLQELRQATSGSSSAAPSTSERQQELRQTTSGCSSAAPSTTETQLELRQTTSGCSSAAPSVSGK